MIHFLNTNCSLGVGELFGESESSSSSSVIVIVIVIVIDDRMMGAGTADCVFLPLTLAVPWPLYKSIGAINVFV